MIVALAARSLFKIPASDYEAVIFTATRAASLHLP
jgi:hypothetical protein